MANVIITNLSKLNIDKATKKVLRDAKKNTKKYSSDLGEISGVHTNDAPIKYLISMIAKKGERVDKIIAVTTKEAKPTFMRLKRITKKYGIEANIDVSECAIEHVYAADTELANTIDEIVGYINSGDKVYIDTTGGFRNSSYILMAVVRILEYSGIHLEKAVYSNMELQQIQDITGTYNMFNLINSVNSFASFGNSKDLIGFFKDSQRTEIIDLLHTMNDFSDSVALCRTSDLDSHLNALNSGLDKLQKLKTNIENEVLFKSISRVIREKFSIDSKDHIDHLDVINWCIKNQLIQQAVTVYTEKLGTYLFKTKKAFYANEAVVETYNIPNNEFDKYYNMFWTGLMALEPECNHTALQLMMEKYENNNLKNILADSKNLNDFEKKASYIKTKNDKDLRNELKLLFRVKNAMFNDKSERNSEEDAKEKLADYPELIIITEATAKAPIGLINTIFGNQIFLRALSERYKNSHYDDIHINTIEHLEDAYNNQKKSSGKTKFTINIPLKKMRRIMRDYLYIKNCLRNSINHASDNYEVSDSTEASKRKQELSKYFAEYGYNTDNNPSLDKIVNVLEEAVNYIKSV